MGGQSCAGERDGAEGFDRIGVELQEELAWWEIDIIVVASRGLENGSRRGTGGDEPG